MQSVSSNVEGHSMRITRARAKTLTSSQGLPPLHPCVTQDGKQVRRASSKRAASDDNKSTTGASSCVQPKKRAVLGNVTNVVCESSYFNCMTGTKIQVLLFFAVIISCSASIRITIFIVVIEVYASCISV